MCFMVKIQCYKEQYCIGNWNVSSMNQVKLDVARQEKASVNIDILGISELKWMGMGDCNSNDQGFPGGSDGKNPPAMWVAWVWSLGWGDPLEESVATHSSILAHRIPWTEEPGGLQSLGSQRAGHDWATTHSTHTSPPSSSLIEGTK